MAKMITIAKINEDTGIPKRVVWNEIIAGRLKASKVGKQYYIRAVDWQEYLDKRTFRVKTA